MILIYVSDGHICEVRSHNKNEDVAVFYADDMIEQDKSQIEIEEHWQKLTKDMKVVYTNEYEENK